MNPEMPPRAVNAIETRQDAMEVMLKMLAELDALTQKMNRTRSFVNMGDITAIPAALKLAAEVAELEKNTFSELTKITEQFGISRQEVLVAYEAS